jgi:hypothetical protein
VAAHVRLFCLLVASRPCPPVGSIHWVPRLLRVSHQADTLLPSAFDVSSGPVSAVLGFLGPVTRQIHSFQVPWLQQNIVSSWTAVESSSFKWVHGSYSTHMIPMILLCACMYLLQARSYIASLSSAKARCSPSYWPHKSFQLVMHTRRGESESMISPCRLVSVRVRKALGSIGGLVGLLCYLSIDRHLLYCTSKTVVEKGHWKTIWSTTKGCVKCCAVPC